jgi:outer membrane biosynthesis protein TonB
MVSSTFISIGLHISFIIIAYFGMPILKVKEPIEQPIDIVDDTPISSQTSLKLGTTTVKKENEKKIEDKEKKIRKTVPPPPPVPSKKLVDKKNNELKKQKNLNEIADIIKKKPKLKIEKKKEIPKVVSKPRILKQTTPKVVVKPEKIKNKQKENFAKGLLNTLAEAKIKNNEVKKEKANKEDLLNKIKKMAGNSNRQVKKTSLNFSQTDIDRISNHVRKFFNVSYAASEVNNIITLKIITNLDGTVQSVTIIEKSKYMRNKFYRAAADAARRAVLDSSPLPLPKGKEKLFTNMIFDFNTSFIKSY